MGEVIRKSKNGKFVGWYIRYIDADGRRRQRASKQPTHVEARRLLVEVEARIARGLVGIEERRPEQALSVAELFRRFCAECNNPKVKHLEAYRERLRFSLGRIGRAAPQIVALPVSALTSLQVARIRDALSRRHPRGTVRNRLIALSAVLSWAVTQEILSANPAKGVDHPPPPAPLTDFLSAEEVRLLLGEAERQARSADHRMTWSRFVAVSLALRLGLRRGEIFGLRWQDVDLAAGRLTVARSFSTTPKNGKPRHLRLPSPLVEILREWRPLCPATAERLVCPVSYRGVWAMWKTNCVGRGLHHLFETAGCRKLARLWHCLRHTFASHFVMAGGSLLALSQILGHCDVKTTMIYAHLAPDFLAQEIERVKY